MVPIKRVAASLIMTWQARTYKLFGPNARTTSPDGEMTATTSITYNEKNLDQQEVIAIGGARY